MSLVLAAATGLLFSAGTWLLLQRRLSRLIIGLGLISQGANLLLLQSGGHRGVAPFVGSTGDDVVADPLPQALALTAIVISFGVTAFLLTLAHRSWRLTGDDLVEDDIEDRRIARGSRAPTEAEEVADLDHLEGATADARGEENEPDVAEGPDGGEPGPGEPGPGESGPPAGASGPGPGPGGPEGHDR